MLQLLSSNPVYLCECACAHGHACVHMCVIIYEVLVFTYSYPTTSNADDRGANSDHVIPNHPQLTSINERYAHQLLIAFEIL